MNKAAKGCQHTRASFRRPIFGCWRTWASIFRSISDAGIREHPFFVRFRMLTNAGILSEAYFRMLAYASIHFSSDFGCWHTLASIFCLISDAGVREHPFFVRMLWNLVPFPECDLLIHNEIDRAVNEESQKLGDVLVPPE